MQDMRSRETETLRREEEKVRGERFKNGDVIREVSRQRGKLIGAIKEVIEQDHSKRITQLIYSCRKQQQCSKINKSPKPCY